MLNIFEFTNHISYLSAWLKNQKSGGHGLRSELAAHIHVSSSYLSQVLKEDRLLTQDQSFALTIYMGLSDIESNYFVLLNDLSRASTSPNKNRLMAELQNLKKKSSDVKSRMAKYIEISEEDKAIYYSNWLYTAVRNLSAIDSIKSHFDVAKHLHISVEELKPVLDFLIEKQLCIVKDGSLTYGSNRIFVSKDSPYLQLHHKNWRMQSMQRLTNQDHRNLNFTSPMSLSNEAFDKIRNVLLSTVQAAMDISGPTDSETSACINIDLFRF